MHDRTDLPGRVTTAEALAMFEVSDQVWRSWKRKGWVPWGERTGKGPGKTYDRAELEALLGELGPVGPAYADPEVAGCWRVPLMVTASRRRGPRRAVLIDEADLERVRGLQLGWSPAAGGGYVSYKRGPATAPLRRLLMGAEDGAQWVVHRNRDPLDCRRANLLVKVRPQARNRKMGTVSGRVYTSVYKGVCFVEAVGRWRVQVKRPGSKHVGYFEDEVEAARAYDQAAWEAFGRDALLNFPADDAGMKQAEEPRRKAA